MFQTCNSEENISLYNKGQGEICFTESYFYLPLHFEFQISLQELLLLELDSEASVANLLANCSHSNEKVIPAASPFLWLRAMPSGTSNVYPPVKMFAEDTFANDNLEESLSTAESV